VSVRASEATSKSLVRFDAIERGTHWVSAAMILVLILTAIPLYFGSFFGVSVPRFAVEQIHLWTGIALPVPLLVGALGPWGTRLRRDVARVNEWTRAEITWLSSWGRIEIDVDKFNPGQKLNAVVVASSSVVLLASGVILKWFSLFPLSWRSGSTFVHDLFAWLLVIVILGHVVMALSHREALVSMVKGRVSADWAARHASRWLAENTADHDE
jgi:formate dehydrogenase subunit gamma